MLGVPLRAPCRGDVAHPTRPHDRLRDDPLAPNVEFVEGLPPGWGDGLGGRITFGIAVAFSAFQLVTAAYAFLPSQVIRAMHVGFLLLLGFGLLATLRAKTHGRQSLVLDASAFSASRPASTTGSNTRRCSIAAAS